MDEAERQVGERLAQRPCGGTKEIKGLFVGIGFGNTGIWEMKPCLDCQDAEGKPTGLALPGLTDVV